MWGRSAKPPVLCWKACARKGGKAVLPLFNPASDPRAARSSSTAVPNHVAAASPVARNPCIPGQYLPPNAQPSSPCSRMDGACAAAQHRQVPVLSTYGHYITRDIITALEMKTSCHCEEAEGRRGNLPHNLKISASDNAIPQCQNTNPSANGVYRKKNPCLDYLHPRSSHASSPS